jgi:hypothetical protein
MINVLIFHETDFLQELIPTLRKLLSLRERARANVDEKYIPVSKIDVSWAVVDSLPHLVPNRFLLPTRFLASLAASKIGPLHNTFAEPYCRESIHVSSSFGAFIKKP